MFFRVQKRARFYFCSSLAAGWVLIWANASSVAAPYTATDLFQFGKPDGLTNISVSLNACPQIAGEGQFFGAGAGAVTNHQYHAVLWTGAGAGIDLHPTNLTGYTASGGYGTNGSQQVGFGVSPAPNGHIHAMLWNGSSNSAVDLHPTNLPAFTNSEAYATSGTQQVGSVYLPNVARSDHAVLWNGTSIGIDLHPTNLPGYTMSIAYGVAEGQQVGYGRGLYGYNHALLWNGTSIATDLTPSILGNFPTRMLMAPMAPSKWARLTAREPDIASTRCFGMVRTSRLT